MSTLKASKIVPLSASLIIDSTTTTVANKLSAGGTAGNTPLAPLQVYGASTPHGADNSGTVLVSNTNNTRQLQIGVNDSSQVAWLQGWIPTSAGLTLAIQPSGGNVGIRTTTPTVALDVNGTVKGITLTASSGIVLGGATFAAPSGSAPLYGCRAFLNVIGFTGPALSGNYGTTTSGLIKSQQGSNLTATQVGRGYFRFDFTTPMPNNTYAVFVDVGMEAGANGTVDPRIHTNESKNKIDPTTSTFYVGFFGSGDATAYNPRDITVSVFG